MDGAKYHKRNTVYVPTQQKRKADIQEWLRDKGIAFDARMVKAELLELVARNRGKPAYAAQLIASKYGHTLYFTPPYHPELQPIELVWGMVKNRVALCPSKNVAELEERLWSLFGEVKSHHWVSSYRKAQAYEDRYEALDEDVVLVSSGGEEDSNDGSSIGSD
ncbi:hypothetical protein H257_06683 [Aphanomyces astaci]|uniref:Tc1-like transposase DDE domain-containing protein n=1 Tax=Aphanomyces astaci TaxID=112090 RepID=W4GMX3_APHAT|nr:hypothetical protein H257_06683 [Aphanomyces astaci]ETV80374.1 hypothetical protein H257_06683 [Aphanomyces astaci]|eukprot:XP_009830298.1 hypothetical protein H257_06683 [Aphanomyces astaci]